MRKGLCIVAFFVLFCVRNVLAGNAESITSFESVIQVAVAGTVTVTETITVRSTGESIKHGIYRDFPTRYKDRLGNTYVVDFTVVKVMRAGQPEEYRSEPVNNGVRVYIGSKAVLLSPGEHIYTLEYRTNRQLGFFKDYDELYWNVTGNGWSFPIEKASATVILPLDDPRKVVSSTAYTGVAGARGADYDVTTDTQGNSVFRTTRALAPMEGLTIAVSWPKGFVREPNAQEKLAYLLRDNSGALVGFFAILAVLAYYFLNWLRFGRDPAKGTIIPLFDPPLGVSPAAARFLTKMEYDQETFAAAVINMAVQKYLIIEEQKGSYTLTRTGVDDSALSSEEKAAAASLFSHGKSIALKDINHAAVSKAINQLTSGLRNVYENNYFFTNKHLYVGGVLLSLAGIVVSVFFLSKVQFIAALFICVWLSIWSIGVSFLLAKGFGTWKRCLGNWQGVPYSDKVQAIFLTLFTLPFIAGEIVGIFALVYFCSFIMLPILLGIVAVNVVFYQLLKAPTLLGRRIMDQLEGFKMYLAVAEKDRLNLVNPPQETPQLFEKYLPYALALGVEQQWAERFSGVLATAGSDGNAYHPAWYHGSTYPLFAAASIASFGDSFSNAISSSSTPPGSSSGSGGGGSSGGGGGGGGGGGW